MLITDALECWGHLTEFRKNRKRCRDYTFGRQWNDRIEVDGKRITEYEYIIKEGNIPLKNNLIRRIVRNVLGVFQSRLPDIMKSLYNDRLEEVALQNSMEEIFSRSMEEFLISGMVVHRKRLGYLNGKAGVWTEIVSPGSFFFNTDARDVRGWDLRIVGQLHKVDFNEWCNAFVKNPDDYRKALALFETAGRKINVTEVWKKEFVSRYLLHDRKRGLLVTVSEKEGRKSRLPKKWVKEEIWRYYFLNEDGTVLCEGDSPYQHGSHPYVMKCYPFLDGEIQSFVGDLIDQQRYTNRLVTLYDWVIRASAKGVLLIPEGAVEPGNLQNVADEWGRFNGVIMYKAKPENPEPKQINGNMSNLGISELLEIQLKMMEDVSGVNGILQGNTSGGNVSGELYNRQTTNAMYSLSDIMQTFTSFITDCADKDRSLVEQGGVRSEE